MATKNNSNSAFWLSLITMSFLIAVTLAFVTQDYVRRASVLEAQKIEAALGPSTLEKVNELAGDWYLESIDKLDQEMSLNEMMSKDPAQKRREEEFLKKNSKVVQWAGERKEAILDLIYWVYRRVALFLVWLPLWIPIVALSIFHGICDREIKKTDFGYTSPVLNHWARSVMSIVTFAILMLFITPIALEPIVFPIMLGVWAVAVGIAFGNIQKRI